MSFSSEQKNEIMNMQVRSLCCRRSFFLGALLAKGYLEEGTVTISVENREMASYLSVLSLELFGREGIVASPKTGGRCVLFSFQSHACEMLLTDLLSGEHDALPFGCQNCKGAFLRGVFFACGRISDPQKQYLLELSLGNRATFFLKTLESFDLYFKLTERRKETILYLKKSESIEDFFACAGMNQTAFAFMNSKIENNFRNDANRIANCETNNIEKAVSASHEQVDLIKRLDSLGLLSSLPEELEKTAKLRLLYPDYSLSQLSALSVPPISKSGISHRMDRIAAMAEEMLKYR